MSSFGVVLDACVLIPSPIRDTLLRAAEKAMYRLHWSEDILVEVERNLIKREMTTSAGAKSLVAAIREYFPEARVDGYQSLIPVMTNHQDDRHVLAAAVVAHAQVIVTANLKDFPDDALDPYGIEAQSPDEFLENLFDLDPELMVEIIETQASDLKNPPMSVEELLTRLATSTPRFVALIRYYQYTNAEELSSRTATRQTG